MKKLIALLFIAVVVLLVVGCKGEEAAEETAEETTETTTTITEEYNPDVVDNLTTDFDEMSW